ncbi:hypothetical protein N7508_010294 [Penicillium antarcticum]|uniref:uncharacterized protein n=1 Tax=Penicillium antarcticum TaxID=416450 RepID=UPI0023A19E1F|nr:uncharacterized protein N7508_010294 [Penicillium antarcticum]KAJ5295473.1 hypothetical protein N7508_010294 [Penicillium antarcticum]
MADRNDGYHEHEFMVAHGGAQDARIRRSQDRDGGLAVHRRKVVKISLPASICRSERGTYGRRIELPRL